ncbi:hypothetical protein HK102_000240 [Quaeritorhiza haematococci]|nr:hypothetical protein HK102_000240 [Quaeritorhiza haematococci]
MATTAAGLCSAQVDKFGKRNKDETGTKAKFEEGKEDSVEYHLARMQPVTPDGGILKLKLRDGDLTKGLPKWERGSNALFHWVTHTFAQKEEKKKTKKASHSCSSHGHDHEHHQDEQRHSSCGKGTCKDKEHQHHEHTPKKGGSNGQGPHPLRTKVGSSWEYDDGKTFEMRIGLSFAVPAFETCVKTMRVGEKARFLCMPEHIQGYIQLETVLRKEKENRKRIAKGLPPLPTTGCCGGGRFGMGGHDHSSHDHDHEHDDHLDPNSLAFLYSAPLEIEIELLDVVPPGGFTKEVWEMTAEEKWAEAPKRKEEGTALYRRGCYLEAADKYARALVLLESLSMSSTVTDVERERQFQERERKERERKEREEAMRLQRKRGAMQAAASVEEHSIAEKAGESSTKQAILGMSPQTESIQPHSSISPAAESRTSVAKPSATSPQSTTPSPPSTASNTTTADASNTFIEPAEVRTLMNTTRLNYAACKLKLGDLPTVVAQCTEVLSKDSTSVKALFRRGQAYTKIGRDLDLAQKDFATIQEILEGKLKDIDRREQEFIVNIFAGTPRRGVAATTDEMLVSLQKEKQGVEIELAELRKEMKVLDAKIKAYKQKEKKMYSNIFS